MLCLDVTNLTPGKDAPLIRPLLQPLADKWHTLGVLLGFDQESLSRIGSSGGTSGSYLDRLITKWLYGDSVHPPTLQNLIAALTCPHINEEKTVIKLLEGSYLCTLK